MANYLTDHNVGNIPPGGVVCETVEKAEQFGVVILVLVGFIWGTMEQTIKAIRTCVRNGGYIMIEDDFISKTREIYSLRVKM